VRLPTYNDRVVVIVDAHSSAAFLAPAFLCHGFHAIHVQNLTERSPRLRATVVPETFIETVDYHGDLRPVLDRLAVHDVAYVVAGMDSGVGVADALATALDLEAANPVETSAARRDKGRMQEALVAAGVPAGRFRVVASGREARRAADEIGGAVVVKPLKSSGTDGVLICASPEETESAAGVLLAGRDHYGKTNGAVLVQEYLEGDEFMVNAVSAAGEHRVLEIWRSVKRDVDDSRVYDFQDLLSGDDGDYRVVADYSRRVLDAVDHRWGPSHTEVIVTAEGPRLVEVGARLAGSISPTAVVLATGQNQIVSTVRAFLDPDAFLEETPQPLPLRRHCRGVSLISPRSGVLARDLDWRRFELLPAFHGLRPLVREGDQLPRTADLLSRPGGLYLVHEDADVVEADYEQIRRWEAEALYAPLVAS
jgi:hypothetical protein